MRGRAWCIYLSDAGVRYAVQVDDDYANEPARGWTRTSDPTVRPLPRRWRPRYVVGQDELGHRITARVGTTTATLWTNPAATFTFEASDLTRHTATVFRRIGEVLRPGPGI